MKNKLEERIKEWKTIGKNDNDITWGMLCDGFQSLAGIPDDFYSAEDPADRVKLWNKYKSEENKSWDGSGSSDGDREYKD